MINKAGERYSYTYKTRQINNLNLFASEEISELPTVVIQQAKEYMLAKVIMFANKIKWDLALSAFY